MNLPDWFSNSIRQGLQMLVVLSLRGTPMDDTVEFTAEVWEGVVWDTQVLWETAADSPRIRSSFARLAGTVDRWPAPRNLLDAMPSRPERQKLMPPPPTSEQRAHGREMMRQLVERFVKKAKVMP